MPDSKGGDGNPLQGGCAYVRATPPPDAEALLLHELNEAMSALGNYLWVTCHKLKDYPGPQPDGLGEILAKSVVQYERAAAAVRRLREQRRRDGAAGRAG